jgi:hypothetical protein
MRNSDRYRFTSTLDCHLLGRLNQHCSFYFSISWPGTFAIAWNSGKAQGGKHGIGSGVWYLLAELASCQTAGMLS